MKDIDTQSMANLCLSLILKDEYTILFSILYQTSVVLYLIAFLKCMVFKTNPLTIFNKNKNC